LVRTERKGAKKLTTGQKMSLIAEKIEQIKREENLTTSELFTKYPHLADLLIAEQEKKKQEVREGKEKKQLLKG